jgi:hypothetical protein
MGYKVRRGLGARARTLADVVQRESILAPGIEEPAVRPKILDHHLQRIRGGTLGRPAELVVGDINAPRVNHTPTRALVLNDVVLFDRAFYSGMHKHDLFRGKGFWPTLLEGPAADLESAVFATTYAGARWYGHFLHDEFPLQELAATLGTMVGHARPAYAHEAGWRSLLKIPSPALYGSLRVRELTVLDDLGQHPDKRRRYAAMRARIPAGLGRNERVLLMRGRSGGEERRILNEEEIVQRLTKEGFRFVDTSTGGVDEIVRGCAGASLVLTVDGSHAAPALYLAREGATVLVLYPPVGVNIILPQLATFFGLRGAMFVGEAAGDAPSVFRVDPEELAFFIDDIDGRRKTAVGREAMGPTS